MSTFAQLWGDELDRELGSADRTSLFTEARRKAAINAGQLEFVRQSECLTRQDSISLTTDVGEYDLDTLISDFGGLTKQGVSIEIVEGSNTRYLEGDDLTQTTVERLDQEEPGWRSVDPSTPRQWYLRRSGGSVYLGLHPKPSFSTGTWAALVQSLLIPADMSADADVPFTVSSNAVMSLRWYHRALAYWAAHDLERYRKDPNREGVALQKFEQEVEKYIAAMKPKTGRPVRVTVDYRRNARMGSGRVLDPRRWP